MIFPRYGNYATGRNIPRPALCKIQTKYVDYNDYVNNGIELIPEQEGKLKDAQRAREHEERMREHEERMREYEERRVIREREDW